MKIAQTIVKRTREAAFNANLNGYRLGAKDYDNIAIFAVASARYVQACEQGHGDAVGVWDRAVGDARTVARPKGISK